MEMQPWAAFFIVKIWHLCSIINSTKMIFNILVGFTLSAAKGLMDEILYFVQNK